eukprot:TRINITY_DN346_c0_g1_i1.p1 TRINITY_DN346_c0_g1~~TRINITY_DN346_c0_g1_i1.p1  ORF type:complete len:374 (-),score=107.56 TRINITY_DN346_c0_g1_i1:23-1144(-)
MSRRREFEIMFGSDSFLDVVANIVGILIILIVIAGVRISQTPAKAPSGDMPGLGLPADLAPESEEPASSEVVVPEPAMAEAAPEPEVAPEPLPELVAPPTLVERVRELEAEIATITLESQKLGESLAGSNRLQSDLDSRLQTARGLLEERKSEISATEARDAQQKLDLELTRQAAARLLAQVTELEKKSPPVEKLQHRITPVSRTVDGRELHFRLEKNRIAEVPIDALVERLKEHIERRKDWIVKTKQHKGQVGPINGFNLEYIIGVEMVSSLEELRSGMGGYRMSMRYWEIHPEESMRGEPEDVALSQGSRFYQALVSAGQDTTLTFWVYPDSYQLYRKIQAFAHEQGFPIAEIGRAVQQECRDRSRMPSSA